MSQAKRIVNRIAQSQEYVALREMVQQEVFDTREATDLFKQISAKLFQGIEEAAREIERFHRVPGRPGFIHAHGEKNLRRFVQALEREILEKLPIWWKIWSAAHPGITLYRSLFESKEAQQK